MNKKFLKNNESGVMSIIVTLIFIIVVGLIIMGFSLISKSQNNQTKDSQLNTASYDAAQSAINEMIPKLLGASPPISSGCNSPYITTVGNFLFNSSNNSKITCLSWTNTADTIVANTEMDNPSIIYGNELLLASNGSPYSGAYNLKIEWSNINPSGTVSSCSAIGTYKNTTLSGYNSSCPAGVLRLDFSIDPSPTSDRATLNKDAETMFLIPNNSTTLGSGTFSKPSAGSFKPAQIITSSNTGTKSVIANITCDTTSAVALPCSWINMRSIYANQHVVVTATSAAGAALQFKNSQLQIDATAVTAGVVKRVRANVNMKIVNPNSVSGYALQSTSSICKLITVNDKYATIIDSTDFDSSKGTLNSNSCSFEGSP